MGFWNRDHVIAYTECTDGTRRPVYEDVKGKQFVYDDDCEQVYGVWLTPEDESDLPVIVEAGPPL